MPNSHAEKIDKLSHRELQAECRDENVSSGGKSADLWKRLKAKCQRVSNSLLKLRKRLNERKNDKDGLGIHPQEEVEDEDEAASCPHSVLDEDEAERRIELLLKIRQKSGEYGGRRIKLLLRLIKLNDFDLVDSKDGAV